DFHYDRLSAVPIKAAIEMVKQLRPDLVVLTGDFVTVPLLHRQFHTAKGAAKAAEPCATLLADLQSRLGSVAVLGNHDTQADPARITEALQSKGITVLRNRLMPLEQGGARIWLCGLDSVWHSVPVLTLAMKRAPVGEVVILLVHEPDFADKAAHFPIDLQLSGHSHGGQVWLPGLGAPWLPEMGRKYPRGLYQIGPLALYTN